jgi:hypothetical protein
MLAKAGAALQPPAARVSSRNAAVSMPAISQHLFPARGALPGPARAARPAAQQQRGAARSVVVARASQPDTEEARSPADAPQVRGDGRCACDEGAPRALHGSHWRLR